MGMTTMRLILELMGRVVGFEASLLHVKMVSSEDQEQVEGEEFKHAPMDPHGTLAAQVERRSDMEDMFAQQRKFGFAHVTDEPHGPQG
jgi:hypothetical protein